MLPRFFGGRWNIDVARTTSMFHRGEYRAGAGADLGLLNGVGGAGEAEGVRGTGGRAGRGSPGAGHRAGVEPVPDPSARQRSSYPGRLGRPKCPFRCSRHSMPHAPYASPAPGHAGPRKCQRARLTCGRPFTECMGGVMEIDCRRCEMRGAGCQDCVVTFLEPRNVAGFSASAPSHLGEAELRALSVLAAAGMVPPLRFALPGSTVLPGARAWTPRVFPAAKAS